jgi:hypothetical protein
MLPLSRALWGTLKRPIEIFSREEASTDLSPAFQDFSMWICYILQLVKIYHKDSPELRIPQWGGFTEIYPSSLPFASYVLWIKQGLSTNHNVMHIYAL